MQAPLRRSECGGGRSPACGLTSAVRQTELILVIEPPLDPDTNSSFLALYELSIAVGGSREAEMELSPRWRGRGGDKREEI